MRDRADREKVVRLLESDSPMFGLRGSQLWAQRNIPAFQREAGEMLRFLMGVMEVCSEGIRFSNKGWEYDALEVDGMWAGCVTGVPGPENRRLKAFCYNPQLFEGKQFHDACEALWKTWLGYDKCWANHS
eukprot:9557259-Alexandrium_andersonii.AAC.1